MKLFFSHSSPYARMVRVLIRELGLEVDEIETITKDNPEELIKANPLGKIPVLQIGEQAIFDSQVILRYLDDTYGEGQYQPRDLAEATWLATVQGIVDEALTMTLEKKRPEPLRYSFWVQRYQIAIPRSLTWLEQTPGVLEDSVNQMRINLAVALDYLDFRHPELHWREGAPLMHQWHQSFRRRPSFLATKPY